MKPNINGVLGGGLKESGYLAAGRITPAKRLMFLESLADFQTGRLSEAKFMQRLQENMSTSDFPLLFADIVDREVLMGYQEKTTDLSSYIRFTVNSNFNPRKMFAVDGGEGVNGMVKELAPYPENHVSEAKYEVSVDKYGGNFAFSFENFINDGLGLLADSIPRRMGKRCRRTEETVLTKLFATDAAIAALFTAANKNIVATSLYSGLGLSDDNTALSLLGVIDAYKILSMQVDSDGQPISIEGATIVYPSHMQPIVDNIKNALSYEFRSTVVGTSDSERIVTTPYLAGSLNWVPNAQLAIVGGTNKMTGWFMFANPRSSRPAIVAARLRGHEQPELFMKSPNAVAIGGGGLVDAFQGSFENDGIEFKCRQFIGGATVDPKAVIYSNGTGNA